MTATRPMIVTPAYAAAITDATLDLAGRIRALTGTPDDSGDSDQAATLASDYLTSLMRRGWRPTNAQVLPDWHWSRRQPPEVARRGAGAARDLLAQSRRRAPE